MKEGFNYKDIHSQEKEIFSTFNKWKEWMRYTYEKIKEMAEDIDVREGVEPSIRTVINMAITMADVFPGVGDAVSWGADALKILARIELDARKRKILAEGGDPEKEKEWMIDLTPDVSLKVALLTELFEPLTAGLFPSHGIETSVQLYHDWPKIRRAARRMREIYKADVEISEEERSALTFFSE